MTLISSKLLRPTIRTPREDADRMGSARIYVEVDAGTAQGVHIAVDLKIAFARRAASGLAPVVDAVETSSAELSDQHSADDLGDGWHVVTLFGEKVPVSRLKTKRRRFGRRR